MGACETACDVQTCRVFNVFMFIELTASYYFHLIFSLQSLSFQGSTRRLARLIKHISCYVFLIELGD